MSDPLAGLPIPSRAYDQRTDDLEALSRDTWMLEGDGRMLEILEEELKHLSGPVLLREIARHHKLAPGQAVAVKPRWRKWTADGKFPITNISGKTTEVGFRQMVRAQVLGTAEDIQTKQYNGLWRLCGFSIRKTREGDTGFDVRNGVVVKPDEPVYMDLGGVPSGALVDPRTGKSFVKDTNSPRRDPSRIILRIDYTFVDISGSGDVEYFEGRPDDGRIKLQKTQGSNMDRLVAALSDLASSGTIGGGGAKAPVAPPADPVADLLSKTGMSKEDLIAAVKQYNAAREAMVAEPDTEEPPTPVFVDATKPKGPPLPLEKDGDTWMWVCPLCDKKVKAWPVSVSAHLSAHVRANEMDEDRKVALFSEFGVLNEQWVK